MDRKYGFTQALTGEWPTTTVHNSWNQYTDAFFQYFHLLAVLDKHSVVQSRDGNHIPDQQWPAS